MSHMVEMLVQGHRKLAVTSHHGVWSRAEKFDVANRKEVVHMRAATHREEPKRDRCSHGGRAHQWVAVASGN